MSKDISNLLKEATKDLLSDESLKFISEAIEKRADEKTQLAVEAALISQDEEYANKLEKVLEAIDADHTAKLDKVVSRIDVVHSGKFKHALNTLDETHAVKLVKLVKLYENALSSEAESFKTNLVTQLSNYIDLYIDKAIPAVQIQEATENTRSRKIVDEIKRLVSLSDAFVNENIKEALLDGKKQIDEANAQVQKTQQNLKLITEKAEKLEKTLFLEKKLENYPPTKREFMARMLTEKSLANIKENFSYVSELYDKQESEELAGLKATSKGKTDGVDVAKANEVLNESKSFSSADSDESGSEHVANAYLKEFTKPKY